MNALLMCFRGHGTCGEDTDRRKALHTIVLSLALSGGLSTPTVLDQSLEIAAYQKMRLVAQQRTCHKSNICFHCVFRHCTLGYQRKKCLIFRRQSKIFLVFLGRACILLPQLEDRVPRFSNLVTIRYGLMFID